MTAEERNQRINCLRYYIATEVSDETDCSYCDIFQFLKHNKVFESWTDAELINNKISNRHN